MAQLPELKAEAGGSGEAGGPGPARTEGASAAAAGEHDRSGSAADEDAQRGLPLRKEDSEQAHEQGVELFVPPKAAKNPQNRGHELEAKRGDSEAVLAWKQRMAGEEGKEIYKLRAATSETVNADLRSYRGLMQFTVRSLNKIKCVAPWCTLAYNILHFGRALLG
jgi:hypothetical protein